MGSPGGATSSSGSSSPRPHTPPEAGTNFGPYHLVRLLGQGGMGAVYEAEQVESGRRVALKILSQSLDSSEARARFLREGRLAASVNHPNSVYIYGTEEIEGTPAIAMELVSGGTIEDRVKQKGPMAVPEAVDAILQIIEGLEAAQAVGVLHRDVKPSNCFIENDGTVKVGDFGLSISTKGRAETDLTVSGTFMGTPAFSSPEQLKGDELDVRSDIYAVGVTLYYLLTGKTPFKADNLVRFVATVLERPAESPATLRREIPKGLCAAVLRCLEKQPARRFRNYSELRAALLPYTAAAPTPATIGWRFLAYLIDGTIWSALFSPLGYLAFTHMGSLTDPASYRSPLFVAAMLGGLGLYLLYFALSEGLWGASIGKAICRLRVVGPGRNVPGVPRALFRAVIFLVLPVLPTWIYFGVNMGAGFANAAHASPVDFVFLYAYYIMLAVLFATARRRNGFAGLHDLASGTRVIQKAAYEARPQLEAEEQPQPVSEATPRIGPYYILDRLEKTEAGELLLGYDARLLRKVWIRRLPEGAPPVAAGVRSLGRATRLRWLGGIRAAGENWDAYEAPAGKSLRALIARPQPWNSVRYWLMDLAEELAAGLKDGSVPVALALDRVWITAGGRAKLLDFAAPGTGGAPRLSGKGGMPTPPLRGHGFGKEENMPSERRAGHATPDNGGSAAPDFQAARAFLNQVAVAALEGRIVDADVARSRVPAVPVPLHARTFLAALPTFEGTEPLLGGLKPLLQKVASVTRRRRFGLVAVCAAVPILMAGLMLVGQLIMRHWMVSQPDIMPLQMCLFQVSMLEKQSDGKDLSQELQALGIYIAGRFGKTISDPATWASPIAVIITPDLREKARQIVAKYPNPSEKEIAEATAVAKPLLGGIDVMQNSMGGGAPLSIAAMQAGFIMVPLVIGSLFCAIAFRRGLAMVFLGVVAVKRDGSRAGRLRVLWRATVTWSPYVLVFIGLMFCGAWMIADPTVANPAVAADISLAWGMAGGIALGLFGVLAVVSALMPERGLQDRLAGTWLVPR